MVWVLFGVLAASGTLVLMLAYICYRKAFFARRNPRLDAQAADLPNDRTYAPYREAFDYWLEKTQRLPYEEMWVTSFDGLTLRGKYYERTPGAPIELMFHGYRGTAERDLAGCIQRCFALGRNAFMVDQRCSGKSQGNVITFGILEHRDCLTWVDMLIKHFGPDVKIVLAGISMGAATVLMAAGKPLPGNVIGVLADCGYSSPKEIIQSVIKQKGFPPKLAYIFVKLGAKLFGHFDLEETTPLQAIKDCKVPVIFFHGQTDDYVPCRMSQAVYDACPTRKRLVTVPGAGHGLSYPVAPETYLTALREFFDGI